MRENRNVVLKQNGGRRRCYAQFTVKNFKSIRDEMTFDMQAAAISEHEDRIMKR